MYALKFLGASRTVFGAGMTELVDVADLKSAAAITAYGFDPRFRHHEESKPSGYPLGFSFIASGRTGFGSPLLRRSHTWPTKTAQPEAMVFDLRLRSIMASRFVNNRSTTECLAARKTGQNFSNNTRKKYGPRSRRSGARAFFVSRSG